MPAYDWKTLMERYSTAIQASQLITIKRSYAEYQPASSLSNKLNLIAGVHQGFSPSGPGATGIDPESSTNYEFGGRYKNQNTYAELFGFYSDYSNLLGRCRVSDFGCDPGQVFSGGEVTINGLEVFGEQTFAISPSTTLRLGLTYTYTKSEFQSSFLSTFSQFGAVKQGDELPYLPEHLAKISADFPSKLGFQALSNIKAKCGRNRDKAL